MVIPFFEAQFTLPTFQTEVPTHLRMWRQAGGEWTALDLAALRIVDITLDVGYSHPRRLSFTVLQPPHAAPFEDREGIVFTDERYGGFGTPLFEGFLHEIQPAGANEVRCVAYDASARAAEEIFVNNAPVTYSTAMPRSVYNCKNDNDEDKAFERREDASVGEIVTDLLSDPYAALVAMTAAPPPQIGGPAYDPQQLQELDFVPQEKVVFDSETLRSGLSRMLGYYPSRRLLFHPGHFRRKWLIHEPLEAPAVELRLNDFAPGSKKILSMALERNLDQRWTAVRIFGPERTHAAVAHVSDGDLTPLWSLTEQTLMETAGPEHFEAHVGAAWQIADPDRRHLAKLSPVEFLVPTSSLTLSSASASMNLTFARTRRPALVASWDGGQTWEPIGAIRLDLRDGVVRAPHAVVKQIADGSWSFPDDVRFYYAYYAEPLSVRYPESGFAGTAYEQAGVEAELALYDEALAVGYEFGTPVTTEERLAEFSKLAQSIHRAHSDVTFAGGCVLEGLDYEFLHLRRRANFSAVGADGQPIVTGWENAGAVVTDVEYDFSNDLTTLQFSSDRLEFLQTDPETLKQRLKIRPYETIQWLEYVIGGDRGDITQSFILHTRHVPEGS